MSIDDLGGLRQQDCIEPKFIVLQRIFYSKPKEKRSLIISILLAYKWEYLIAFTFCMVGAMFSYISPFIVQMIIEFLQGKAGPGLDNTYCYKLMGILVGSQFFSYILSEHMLYYQMMIGSQSTNNLISLIYQKQLRLSQATNKKFGQGEIVNFVQVDAEQLFWLCAEMSDVI